MMAKLPDNNNFPTISRGSPHESTGNSGALPEIEGYQIIGKLGEGGMGTVWRAVQLGTRREVALKVMSLGAFASEKAQFRFEREVELAARLQHPNIAHVYDSGLHHGLYYYAMELIDGQHLDEYVKRHKLNQRQTLELMQLVCQAVTHAHQLGVIHRDLKPSNILVTEDGQPRVLDFGLAKTLMEKDSSLTVSAVGEMVGTLPYMSPEQAMGQSDLVDVRTDVYSLGVITYYMLTGQYPYDVTGSALEVLQNIQETEPIRPKSIIRKIDSDVEAILLTAIAKERAERYQSAAEMQSDIENWLEGRPIRVRSVSTLYLLRKIIAHHRYTSTVVALLLIIVFGFSCFYYQLYTRLRETNIVLEDTIQSLDKETAQYAGFAQKISITPFLQAWHAGQLKQAQYIAKHFVRGTREAMAAVFLLDPRSLTEKVAEFRQKLERSEPCFAEFIIAEHYLKDGSRAEATKAYKRCLSHSDYLKKDEWFAVQVKSRLFELSAEDRQDETSSAVRDKDEP